MPSLINLSSRTRPLVILASYQTPPNLPGPPVPHLERLPAVPQLAATRQVVRLPRICLQQHRDERRETTDARDIHALPNDPHAVRGAVQVSDERAVEAVRVAGGSFRVGARTQQHSERSEARRRETPAGRRR